MEGVRALESQFINSCLTGQAKRGRSVWDRLRNGCSEGGSLVIYRKNSDLLTAWLKTLLFTWLVARHVRERSVTTISAQYLWLQRKMRNECPGEWVWLG